MPAANRARFLAPVTVSPLLDDFERADGRSTLDTLRLETGDGGTDRTVEISQIVPRASGGHTLLLSARMAMKDYAYAGVAIPLTRGSVTPVDVRRYRGVRLSLMGPGRYTVRLNAPTGSWSATVDGATEWKEIEVPFTALTPMARSNRAGPAWSGTDIVTVEVGAARAPGATLGVTLDDIRFY